MKNVIAIWALATVCLDSAVVHAEVSAEVAATPEYKKCMLQKDIDLNDDAVKAYKEMIANSKEDNKVVGYATLGNQANINDAKRHISWTQKEQSRLRQELKTFSKVKVNCKELETSLRTTATETCVDNENKNGFKPDCQALGKKYGAAKMDRCIASQGKRAKAAVEDCNRSVEGDAALTLWHRKGGMQ